MAEVLSRIAPFIALPHALKALLLGASCTTPPSREDWTDDEVESDDITLPERVRLD